MSSAYGLDRRSKRPRKNFSELYVPTTPMAVRYPSQSLNPYAYDNPSAYDDAHVKAQGSPACHQASKGSGHSGSDSTTSSTSGKGNKRFQLICFLVTSLVICGLVILGFAIYFGVINSLDDGDGTTDSTDKPNRSPRVYFPQLMHDPDFEGSFKLNTIKWDPDMVNIKSTSFQTTAVSVEEVIDKIYQASEYKDIIDYSVVTGLSRGVVVEFKLFLVYPPGVPDEATQKLLEEAKCQDTRVILEFKAGLQKLQSSSSLKDPILFDIVLPSLMISCVRTTTTTTMTTPSTTTTMTTTTTPSTTTTAPWKVRSCGEVRTQPDFRIVGGSAARQGVFPWVVMILRDGKTICGGSILDPLHILSAAHCFGRIEWQGSRFAFVPDHDGLEVVAGKYQRNVNTSFPLEQRVPVAAVYAHDFFFYDFVSSDTYYRMSNDIAVLRLSNPLVYNSRISPICLPTATDTLPRRCLVVGWGRINYEVGVYLPAVYPEELQTVTMRAYTRDECRQTFQDSFRRKYSESINVHLRQGVMCAANLTSAAGQDACYGDSGGPLFCLQDGDDDQDQHYSQFGVVSFGFGCGLPGIPGFYTYIPFFKEWIEEVAIPYLADKVPSANRSCQDAGSVSRAMEMCTRDKSCVSMLEVTLCIHRLLDPHWLTCTREQIERIVRHNLTDSLNLCDDFSVRLTGNSGAFVYLDRDWLALCADHWSQNEVKFVCAQQGYQQGKASRISRKEENLYVSKDLHASGWMHVNCSGSESSLAECQTDRRAPCSGHYMAAAICYNTSYQFDLMPEEAGRHYGYVQLTWDENQGYACFPDFSEQAAELLCQEAGYVAGMTYGRPLPPALPGPVWSTQLECGQGAWDLNSCVGRQGWKFGKLAGNTCHRARVFCFDSQARFHNGLFNTTGIVQLYRAKDNGRDLSIKTVCRDSFDNTAAGIVCRQIGFSKGGRVVNFNPFYVPQTGYITINCRGQERTLENCAVTDFAGARCSGPAVARCISDSDEPAPPELSVKLASDNHQVLVYHDGQWGTVCADHWTHREAAAVCRQLGHRYGYTNVSTLSRSFAHVLHAMHCQGNVTSLQQCSFQPVASDVCQYLQPAAVYCTNVSRPEFSLQDDSRPNVGRVYVLYRDISAPLMANMSELAVGQLCRSMGYITGQLYYPDLLQGVHNNYSDFWWAEFDGNCSSSSKMGPEGCLLTQSFELINCVKYPFNRRCFYDPVVVFCYKSPVRVHLGFDNTTGIMELYHNGSWWAACEQYVPQSASDAFCRELMNSSSAKAIRLTDSDSYYSSSAVYVNRASFNISCDEYSRRDIKIPASKCMLFRRGRSYCYSNDAAAVVCYDGRMPTSAIEGWALGPDGRVLVKRYGSWGTVCYYSWSSTDAKLFCQKFGYSRGNRLSRLNNGRPRWVRNVYCSYSDDYWSECSVYRMYPSSSCYSSYDSAVNCYGYTNSTTTMTTPTTTPSTTTTPLPDVLPGPGGDKCGEIRPPSPSPRIVGGTEASVGQFPWMVMLLKYGSFQCGGTIIDHYHIVTAAHCIISISRYSNGAIMYPYALEIIAGKHRAALHPVYLSEQRKQVSAARTHPSYRLDYGDYSNDIAILRLESPLRFNSRVCALCLPESSDQLPKTCVLAGWGRDGGGDYSVGDFPDALMTVVASAYSRAQCKTYLDKSQYSDSYILPYGVMCSGNLTTGGVGTCKGDSGSAVSCLSAGGNAYQLMGIVSWGMPYCRLSPNYPSVDTFVPYYRDWIDGTRLMFSFMYGLANKTCFSSLYLVSVSQAADCITVISTLSTLNDTQTCTLYRESLSCVKRKTGSSCSEENIHKDLLEFVIQLTKDNTSYSYTDNNLRLLKAMNTCAEDVGAPRRDNNLCEDQSLVVSLAGSSLCNTSDSLNGTVGTAFHNCLILLTNLTSCVNRMLLSLSRGAQCNMTAVKQILITETNTISGSLGLPKLNFTACNDQCLGFGVLMMDKGLCMGLLGMAGSSSFSQQTQCRFHVEAVRCMKVILRIYGYSCTDETVKNTLNMYLKYAPRRNLPTLSSCIAWFPSLETDPSVCQNEFAMKDVKRVLCRYSYYSSSSCVRSKLQNAGLYCSLATIQAALTEYTTTPYPYTTPRLSNPASCTGEDALSNITLTAQQLCPFLLNHLPYISNSTEQCRAGQSAVHCVTWAANYAGYSCSQENIVDCNLTAFTVLNHTCDLLYPSQALQKFPRSSNVSVCTDVDTVRLFTSQLCSSSLNAVLGPKDRFCTSTRAAKICMKTVLHWYTKVYCSNSNLSSHIHTFLSPDIVYVGEPANCYSSAVDSCRYFSPWDTIFTECHDSFLAVENNATCDNLWKGAVCAQSSLVTAKILCGLEPITARLMDRLSAGQGQYCYDNWPQLETSPCSDERILRHALNSCVQQNCTMCCKPLNNIITCMRNFYRPSYCSSTTLRRAILQHDFTLGTICQEGQPSLDEAGRVFVQKYGYLKPMCGDLWTDQEALLVCRQAGFVHGVASHRQIDLAAIRRTTSTSYYSWVSYAVCVGGQTRLSQCWMGTSRPCSRFHAAVHCYDQAYNFTLFSPQSHHFSGQIRLEGDAGSGDVCVNSAIMDTEAQLLCQAAGFIWGRLKTHRQLTGTGSKVWQLSMSCNSSIPDVLACLQPPYLQLLPASQADCQVPEVFCSHGKGILNRPDETLGIAMLYTYVPLAFTWSAFPICRDGFSDVEASNLCQGLDYTLGGQALGYNPFYPMGPTFLSLNCTDSKAGLSQCHKVKNVTSCSGPAVVLCNGISLGSEPEVKARISPSRALQVYYKDQWGTVCADHWTQQEAGVVCRQLYNSTGLAWTSPLEPRTWPHLLHELTCTGAESNWSQCAFSAVDSDSCQNTSSAYIYCQNEEYQYKLSGGTSDNYGWVWIRQSSQGSSDNTPYSLLYANLSNTVYSKLCQEMGYLYGEEYQGDLALPIDNVSGLWKAEYHPNCFHTKLAVADLCRVSDWQALNCSWRSNSASLECGRRAAKVYCTNSSVRMHNSYSAGTGIVQMEHKNKWVDICTTSVYQTTANVLCREMMNSSTAAAIFLTSSKIFPQYYANMIVRIQSTCNPSDTRVSDCITVDPYASCYYSNRFLSLACYDGHQPNGTVTDWKLGEDGRVWVRRYGVWGTVCYNYYSYWGSSESRALCQKLGLPYLQSTDSNLRRQSQDVPVWLFKVDCSSSDTTIDTCDQTWAENYYSTCGSSDVKVTCA